MYTLLGHVEISSAIPKLLPLQEDKENEPPQKTVSRLPKSSASLTNFLLQVLPQTSDTKTNAPSVSAVADSKLSSCEASSSSDSIAHTCILEDASAQTTAQKTCTFNKQNIGSAQQPLKLAKSFSSPIIGRKRTSSKDIGNSHSPQLMKGNVKTRKRKLKVEAADSTPSIRNYFIASDNTAVTPERQH